MWWILIKALKSLSNLLFDWCLLCKVYNVWPKKYKGVLIHDAEVSCKIWRTDSKMTGIWWIFTKALRNLKIFTFMGYFCPKYIMFELKKYRGVMFYDNEEWWKIWRIKLTCGLENNGEFDKFSPEHLEMSKLELWWDPFIQNRKCMS